MIRSHPVVGAEMVIRLKEWGELSARLIDAAFEHHLKYDLTGYPKLAAKRNITLFGKIIAISDFLRCPGEAAASTASFPMSRRRSWG